MKTKLHLLFAFFVLGTHVSAQTIKQDGVIYKVVKNEAIIAGYEKDAVSAVIHGEITYKDRNYVVKGPNKFNPPFDYKGLEGKTIVKELIFDKNCSEIFQNIAIKLNTLQRVVIQGPVKKVCREAFSGCKNLQEIVLPESVLEIEYNAFNNCQSLQEFVMPENLEKIGIGAFSGSGIRQIVIPKTVVEVQLSAFYGCSSLKSVIILSNLTQLEDRLFCGCSRMTTIVLPNSVRTVGRSVFENCAQLKDIVLPDKATYYTEEQAKIKKNRFELGDFNHASFAGCRALTNLKCHNGTVPEDFAKYLPNDCPFVMNGCKSEDVNFDQSLLASIESMLTGNQMENKSKRVENSDVDIDIPETNSVNDKAFAVIIGNEIYKSVPAVSFAEHDAKVFADYCHKVLGIPEKNITLTVNASYGAMLKAVREIKKISQAHNGDIQILFYYSGHGVPNESSHDAYLLPVDADGSMTEVCYAVSKLYQDLSSTDSKSITVFLDACFSGAQRDGGVLQASARGVAIKAKPTSPMRNMVVISAATGDETAYPYDSKGHGMFTYYLLKKLQETAGNITLGELSDYVKTEVIKASIIENKKSQTPAVAVSPELKSSWYGMNIK